MKIQINIYNRYVWILYLFYHRLKTDILLHSLKSYNVHYDVYTCKYIHVVNETGATIHYKLFYKLTNTIILVCT